MKYDQDFHFQLSERAHAFNDSESRVTMRTRRRAKEREILVVSSIMSEGKFMCNARSEKHKNKIISLRVSQKLSCSHQFPLSFDESRVQKVVVWGLDDGMSFWWVAWGEGWFCQHNEKYISYNDDKRTCLWLKRWRSLCKINRKLTIDQKIFFYQKF